jgi:TPR repeat protein
MTKNAIIAAMLLALSCGAAAQSDEVSEYNLGVKAFRAKDYGAARLHWGKLVSQAFPEAYNNLGFLLYYGMGGEADPLRARALWRAAAEMKNHESQWHLAQAYEEGKAAPGNPVEAYAWYRCAEAGYRVNPSLDEEGELIKRDASESVVRMLALIPEHQRERAQQLAKVYIDLYLAPVRK